VEPAKAFMVIPLNMEGRIVAAVVFLRKFLLFILSFFSKGLPDATP
jgi:hypothetical protein